MQNEKYNFCIGDKLKLKQDHVVVTDRGYKSLSKGCVFEIVGVDRVEKTCSVKTSVGEFVFDELFLRKMTQDYRDPTDRFYDRYGDGW
jgi:hypothetical protein